MDFWTTFKVKIDPLSQTWSLEGSEYLFPLARRSVIHSELKSLEEEQIDKLSKFLDVEFARIERDATGITDLISHVIELSDPTPHRQKPYVRSEAIREFLDKEVDRLLEKGYVTWSKSDWACSPVVAPKANGGLRFCVDYRPLNR